MDQRQAPPSPPAGPVCAHTRGLFCASLATVALWAAAPPAEARPEKARRVDLSACPYTGLPPVESFIGDNLTIAGIRFNLSRASDATQLQQLLMVCNAAPALTPYVEWKQAHTMVVAKAAQMTAYAVSATARAINADTDKEKRQIAADAAEAAAQLTAELVPLTSDAGAKKQVFQATLMGCMAP
jgi:hypothetical protein